MNLSKALMVAAMGMVSLNLVACASMPAGSAEREPATQSASADQAMSPNAGENKSYEEKMSQWEDRYVNGSTKRR